MFGFFKRQLENQNLLINEAKESDLNQLYNVAISTFQETYIEYIKTKSELEVEAEISQIYSIDRLKDWINNNKYCCLVVRDKSISNKIIGYSLLLLNYPQAKLSKIYLLQSYQGKGVGRILLEANYDRLRSIPKIEEFSLEVWDQNQSAQRFYKRMGFFETGEKVLYPESDPLNPYYNDVFCRERINYALI